MGKVRGQHPRPRPAIHRVLERVLVVDRGHDTPCWIFDGWKDPNGYGRVQTGSMFDGDRRPMLTHRVTFEFFKGPIDEGLEPDHLCNQRDCCNHRHLEAVTHAENMRRSRERKAAACR